MEIIMKLIEISKLYKNIQKINLNKNIFKKTFITKEKLNLKFSELFISNERLAWEGQNISSGNHTKLRTYHLNVRT